MAEGAALPIETLADPVTGRSLWVEARGRLLNNKAPDTPSVVL
jgi:oligopeptide transport system permease protein